MTIVYWLATRSESQDPPIKAGKSSWKHLMSARRRDLVPSSQSQRD